MKEETLPEVVARMIEQYYNTKTYNYEDVIRVLGDPSKTISVTLTLEKDSK